jgi:hypothetical protein
MGGGGSRCKTGLSYLQNDAKAAASYSVYTQNFAKHKLFCMTVPLTVEFQKQFNHSIMQDL